MTRTGMDWFHDAHSIDIGNNPSTRRPGHDRENRFWTTRRAFIWASGSHNHENRGELRPIPATDIDMNRRHRRRRDEAERADDEDNSDEGESSDEEEGSDEEDMNDSWFATVPQNVMDYANNPEKLNSFAKHRLPPPVFPWLPYCFYPQINHMQTLTEFILVEPPPEWSWNRPSTNDVAHLVRQIILARRQQS